MKITNTVTNKSITAYGTDFDAALHAAWSENPEFMQGALDNKHQLVSSIETQAEDSARQEIVEMTKGNGSKAEAAKRVLGGFALSCFVALLSLAPDTLLADTMPVDYGTEKGMVAYRYEVKIESTAEIHAIVRNKVGELAEITSKGDIVSVLEEKAWSRYKVVKYSDDTVELISVD